MSKLFKSIKDKKDDRFVYNYYKQLINDPVAMSEIHQIQKNIAMGHLQAIPIGKA